MSYYQPYNTNQPYANQPYAPTQPVEPTGQVYGQPPQGMAQYPPMSYPQNLAMGAEHPQATTVLVLGILGLVAVGILGPIAWYMGNKAIRECDAGAYRSTESLRAGRILGIIATLLYGTVIVMTIVIIVFGLMFATAM